MKKLLFTLFLVFSYVGVQAQYSKIIVQLKDKGSNTFSLLNPSQFLSARAIQRRTRYNINIDSADLPLSKRYLDSIRLAGNVTILSTSKWLNQVLIQSTDQAAINKIRSFPFVKSATGMGNRVITSPVDDKFKEESKTFALPATSLQRNMADVYNYGNSYNQVHIHEGEFLHNKGFRGENVQIAVLDAGFRQYRTITAFDSVRMGGQVLGERDFVAFDNSVNEDDSHGMFVFSIMSANWPGRMVGTAPKASYWLIRTENAFTEFPVEEHNWVAGAEFADSSGVDMISSSLGYFDFDDPSFDHTYNDFYKNATMITRGATTAAKKGLIVMNSAGNEGNSSWKYIGFPADADSVCAVGAVNASGIIGSFSSYGFPGKVKPNISSVGVGTVIANFDNNPTSGNGTSYSNPNIAGLVACLWQAFPQFNNMKILDAVYKSSDRFNAPNDRYGFGIPNFKTAYRMLKKEVNTALYGVEWLFATPNPFTTQIDAKFIGRIDGNAKLELLNAAGNIISTKLFVTEPEEIYNFSFINLGNLPGGNYTVRYSDGVNTRSVQLYKESSINFGNDWIVAVPVPFNNELTVYIKAPESGVVSLRLTDALGKLIEVKQLTLTQNLTFNVSFDQAKTLQRGAYYVQYISGTQKRTLKVLKQ